MDAPPPRSSRRFVIRVRRPPGGFPPLPASFDGSDAAWAEMALPSSSNRAAYGGKGPQGPNSAFESNGAAYGSQSEELDALANASRRVWLRLRGVKAGYSAAAAGHYGATGSSRPGSNPTSLGPSRATSPLPWDAEGAAHRKRSFDETTNGSEGAAPVPSLLQQAKTNRLVTQLVQTLARPLVQPRRAPTSAEAEGTGRPAGGCGWPRSARSARPAPLSAPAPAPAPAPAHATVGRDRRARRGGGLRQGEGARARLAQGLAGDQPQAVLVAHRRVPRTAALRRPARAAAVLGLRQGARLRAEPAFRRPAGPCGGAVRSGRRGAGEP